MLRRYVVAVSGGVDSVVLLDMLVSGGMKFSAPPIACQSSCHAEESGAGRPESPDMSALIINDWQLADGTEPRAISFLGGGSAESWSSQESFDAPALIVNGGAPTAEAEMELIVAHFDHGIRPDSADDAQFVKELAGRYGLVFETEREELGADASEALARERRYAFLRRVAKKHQAVIATAHHMNDVAETVAINLARGTGWRGLAALAGSVWRPLLGFTKQDLVDYARQHHLEWREDSTNLSDTYLRNRLRQKLTNQDTVLQLAALRSQQLSLRRQIESLLEQFAPKEPFSRQFFAGLEEPLAQEFLRYVTQGRLTRPQLERALGAIRTFRPGTVHQPGGGCELHFSSRYFTMQML